MTDNERRRLEDLERRVARLAEENERLWIKIGSLEIQSGAALIGGASSGQLPERSWRDGPIICELGHCKLGGKS